MSYQFMLSAFGDEIDDDLATQIAVLAAEGIAQIEFRSAWGQNVLALSDDDLRRAAVLLAEAGFGVSAVASPIGKSLLHQPAAFELARLDRAFVAAETLGTRLIRVFSFYYAPLTPADARAEVLDRMGALAARAQAAGFTLLHENEKEIYGDTAIRCQDLLTAVDSPALRSVFDPANFVQCGVQPMTAAWPLLVDTVTHIHIKDAVFADGSVRPAGQGDGAIPLLLRTLVARGYQGCLTLEPHLQIAGPAGGFSGPAGMQIAARALAALLAEVRGD